MEEANLEELILAAMNKAKKEPMQAREIALTVTKLQEALFWYREHDRIRKEKVKQSQVGMGGNA